MWSATSGTEPYTHMVFLVNGMGLRGCGRVDIDSIRSTAGRWLCEVPIIDVSRDARMARPGEAEDYLTQLETYPG